MTVNVIPDNTEKGITLGRRETDFNN
jgi:hypothetical protein